MQALAAVPDQSPSGQPARALTPSMDLLLEVAIDETVLNGSDPKTVSFQLPPLAAHQQLAHCGVPPALFRACAPARRRALPPLRPGLNLCLCRLAAWSRWTPNCSNTTHIRSATQRLPPQRSLLRADLFLLARFPLPRFKSLGGARSRGSSRSASATCMPPTPARTPTHSTRTAQPPLNS